jgi:transposase
MFAVPQSPAPLSAVVGGVDTHNDVHVAAAMTVVGELLGVESFPAAPAAYRALLSWLQSFGDVALVGVEGTGTYGAGLTRHLMATGVPVLEIDRPYWQHRRRERKSDPFDAVAAAIDLRLARHTTPNPFGSTPEPTGLGRSSTVRRLPCWG